jgi:hypothetical protein
MNLQDILNSLNKPMTGGEATLAFVGLTLAVFTVLVIWINK